MLITRVGGAIAKALIPAAIFTATLDEGIGYLDQMIGAIDFDEVQIARGLFDIAGEAAWFFGTIIDHANEAEFWVSRNLIQPFLLFGAVIKDATTDLKTMSGVFSTLALSPVIEFGPLKIPRIDVGKAFADVGGIGGLATYKALTAQFDAANARRIGRQSMADYLQSGVAIARRDMMPRMEATKFDRAYVGGAALVGGVAGAFNREKYFDARGAMADGAFKALDDIARSAIRPKVIIGDVPDLKLKVTKPEDIEFRLPSVAEWGSSEFAKAQIAAVAPRQDGMREFLRTIAGNTGNLEKMLAVLGGIAPDSPNPIPPRSTFPPSNPRRTDRWHRP